MRVERLPYDVGEIIDIEAREVPGLVGGAHRTKRPRERGLAVPARRRERTESRPLGQIGARGDAERQAGLAALKKADRRLDRPGIGLGVFEEVREALRQALSTPSLEIHGETLQLQAREQPREQLDGRVRLLDDQLQTLGVLSKEPREIRRGGIRRIELGHGWGQEQHAHGSWHGFWASVRFILVLGLGARRSGELARELGGRGDEPMQAGDLDRREVPPDADAEPAEVDVHDARAPKLPDLMAEVLAHPSDLPIEPLSQHDDEALSGQPGHATRAGHGVQDGHALGHPPQEGLVEVSTERDLVLLLVRVAGAKNLIDHVAVSRQEDEPL